MPHDHLAPFFLFVIFVTFQNHNLYLFRYISWNIICEEVLILFDLRDYFIARKDTRQRILRAPDEEARERESSNDCHDDAEFQQPSNSELQFASQPTAEERSSGTSGDNTHPCQE